MTNETKALRQMFPGMDEEDLTKLTNVAQVRTYPAEAVLCQEGQVENTVMSGAVLAHYASPVYGKDHREVLEADVMDYLVI